MLVLRGEEVRAGGGEQRIAETGAGARAHRPGCAAMAEERLGLTAPEPLASEGLVHQAE
jgi:hypothetical protein